jgi:hypothetical protein
MPVPTYTLPSGDFDQQCAVLHRAFLAALSATTDHPLEAVGALSEVFGTVGCSVRSGDELFSLTVAKQTRAVSITKSARNGRNPQSINVKALLEEHVIRDF